MVTFTVRSKERLKRFTMILKEMIRQPVGAIGLAFFIIVLTVAILAPAVASYEAYENWNNVDYWKDNPKLALPIWINRISSTKYSVTTDYVLTEDDFEYSEIGFYSAVASISDTYDYDSPFTGMIIYIYFTGVGDSNISTVTLDITIERPDGVIISPKIDIAVSNGTRLDLKGSFSSSIESYLRTLNPYGEITQQISNGVILLFSEWPSYGTIKEVLENTPEELNAILARAIENEIISSWDDGNAIASIEEDFSNTITYVSAALNATDSKELLKNIAKARSQLKDAYEISKEIFEYASTQLNVGNLSSQEREIYENAIEVFNDIKIVLGKYSEMSNIILKTIKIYKDKGYDELPIEIALQRPVYDVSNIIKAGGQTALKGTYNMTFQIKSSEGKFKVIELRVRLLGKAYGFMGTDADRRDIWQGLIWGVRIALIVGVVTSVLSATIGLLYGSVSGYLGGIVDEAMQRIIEIFVNIPMLPIMIAIGASRPRGLPYWMIALLLAIFGWAGIARVIRSMALQMREFTFVEAARCLGASTSRILFKHIIPQMLPYIFSSIAFSIPGAIISEASLSFLGVGDKVHPTWGKILSDAQNSMAAVNNYWWWIFPPGIGIMIIGLTFVFIGMSLDRVLNPRLRRL